MNRAQILILVLAIIFIIGGGIVLFLSPSDDDIKASMNRSIRNAKEDQWNYRTL